MKDYHMISKGKWNELKCVLKIRQKLHIITNIIHKDILHAIFARVFPKIVSYNIED